MAVTRKSAAAASRASVRLRGAGIAAALAFLPAVFFAASPVTARDTAADPTGSATTAASGSGLFGTSADTPPRSLEALRVLSYADTLNLSVAFMERGKHAQALAPTRAALNQDRNDPLGLIALGTLYLHTGSGKRALDEFSRAHTLVPNDPLPTWGIALAQLELGKADAASAALSKVSDTDIPSAPLLRDYLRLLNGQPADWTTIAAKGSNAADPLRTEISAFAAIKLGDSAKGESLLTSLLARPEGVRLAEDRAVSLTFELEMPAQGGAPTLPSAIEFPRPPANAMPLWGRVCLSPPAGIDPMRIGLVTYTIEGTLNSSTNYAPFTADWNTERVPNGFYTLRTTVYDGAHQVLSDTTRTLVIHNENAPASSGRLTEAQAADLRARLNTLLTPRISRKAAHFALAEQAVKRGDTDAALLQIESVVAIDPLFNNARATLYRYNRDTAGPCEGVWRCDTTERLVALTFDDGPNAAPNRTPALLDALKSVNAPGTFFVVGVRAEESPNLLRRMVAEGHEIGNHSYSHPNLTYLTPVAVDRELCHTSVIVREATGKRPRFYRPPGGNFNRAIVDAAKALGMAGAYWTLDGLPYENPPIPPARLTRYVLENVRPGAIVLLHNAPDNTIVAIPDIVRGLRAKGYEVVTMSELVRRARPVVKGGGTVTEKKPKGQTAGRTASSPFYGG